jgi:hypothetical protein
MKSLRAYGAPASISIFGRATLRSKKGTKLENSDSHKIRETTGCRHPGTTRTVILQDGKPFPTTHG